MKLLFLSNIQNMLMLFKIFLLLVQLLILKVYLIYLENLMILLFNHYPLHLNRYQTGYTKILKKQSPSYQTSQNKLQMTTPRRKKDNFYSLHSLHIYYMIYRALLSMHIKHSIMDILYLWRSFGQLIDVDKVGDRLLGLQCRHLHVLWFVGANFGPKWRKKQKWSQYLYQVTQTLPQICTVILRIRIGMVA